MSIPFSKHKSWILISVVIVGLFFAIIVPKISSQIEKARDSETKTNLLSLHIAEKAFQDEFKTYSSSTSELGLHYFGGDHAKLYFSKETVPPEILASIPESEHPFVSDQAYRVLLLYQRDPEDPVKFWVMGENGEPRRLR